MIEIRKFEPDDTDAAVKIWNEVVDDGVAFPQLDDLDHESGLAFFEEHSTYSSTKFLMECIKFFPFKIQCIQTDNGFEFTNRLVSEKKTLFEETLL